MTIYYRVYADTADAGINASSSTYSTARNSTAATTSGNTTATVGQSFSSPTYTLSQYFARFDLSAVPAGGGTGTLSLAISTQKNPASGTMEIAEASSLSNKIAGASLGSLTVLGSAAFSSGASGTRVNVSIADISGISRSSTTNIVCFAQEERTNTAPTDTSSANFFHTADATGSTNDPYLDLVVGDGWQLVGISSVSEVTTTTHTLTEPAGVQQGDLLIACFSIRKNNTTATTLPANWNIVGQQYSSSTATNTSATPSGLMAYIIRGSSAPSYAFTHSGTISVAQGVVLAYRNAAQSGVLDASNSITSGTAVTAINVAAGVTTTQDDDLLVVLRSGGQESTITGLAAATSPTTASGATNTTTHPVMDTWTERVDTVTTTGNDTAISVFDAVKTAAGATGNITATASISSAHVVVTGAFKIVPAPAGDGVGSSSGTGAASGVGASTAASTASSSATGSATGSGNALIPAAGSSAGVGSASAVGEAVTIAAGAGSSSATGSASAVGAATGTAAGSSAGTGAASGVGASTAATAGSSAAVGSVSGVGASTASAAGAAAGAGSASAVGEVAGSTEARDGAAAGVGSATGVGASTAASAGSSSGLGAATGVGLSLFNAAAAASASGQATGAGASTAASAGSSSGLGSATGYADSGISVGTASGSGSASGAGAATIAGAGASSASGAASGSGEVIFVAFGSSSASGAGSAVGRSTANAAGSSDGSGYAYANSEVEDAVASDGGGILRRRRRA